MKALPLWQPWASLVACGAKRVETRHWSAPDYVLGERVAIHATLTKRELWRCAEPLFSEFVPDPDALPLGALLCTVVIARCAPITVEGAARLERENPHEYAFGNYDVSAQDRYAWVLRDVEALPEPVPFTGRQGIFDVPNELVRA